MALFESSDINVSEESCLELANHLISQCAIPVLPVNQLRDIDCNLIILLYESITGYTVPDLFTCENKEEEAHNVQAVIDTLSLDLLGLSLSHITGDAVVAGDILAILSILQVLEGVMLYLSVERNGKRVLKRKISRLKKNFQSVKDNTDVKDVENSTSHSMDQRSYRSISSSYTETALPLQLKKMQPAFSRTRLKVSDEKKSSKSSIKESSVASSSTSHRISTNLKFRDEKTLPQAENFDTSNGDILTVPKEIETIHQTPTNILLSDHYEDPETNMNIPPNTVLLKRKISKLPQSKTRVEDFSIQQGVEELYAKNLESKLKILLVKSSTQTKSSRMKRMHIQKMKKSLKRTPLSPCNKSFLLPYSLRRKSAVYRKTEKHHSPKCPTIKNASPNFESVNLFKQSPSNGFLQDLFEEFPFIQLSPEVIKHIKSKYEQHLLKMHKKAKTFLFRKPKAEIQSEEAAKRQHLISNLLKKDIQEQNYLKEIREQKNHENKIKYRLRDARLKSAKTKQYCDEFHGEMRKKMQKRNTKEELIFKKAFKDAMEIQSDHVDYLCQQVKKTGEEDAKQHLAYLESLENLYHSQFSLLSETINNEKTEAQLRMKAEKQALEKMERDFQEALKQEIRFMQKTIIEQADDCYFRELDAEQFIDKMRNQHL